MQNQYFTVQENYKERFYQIPKVFFTSDNYKDLTNDMKIAYAILRDRLNLSIKNNWVDEDGNIYFIYSNEKLMEILNCRKEKLTKIKRALENAGLLIQKRRGLNKPNILYLMKPIVTECDIYKIEKEENDVEPYGEKEVRKSNVQKTDNRTPGSSKIERPEVRKSNTNDTDFSDTDYNKTELSDTTTIENQKTSSSCNTLKLIKKLENEFNIKVTKNYQKELESIFKYFSDDIIEYAIEYSSNNADYPKKYIKSILKSWKNKDIKTLEEAKNYKVQYKENLKNSKINREKTPKWLLDNKNEKLESDFSENEYKDIVQEIKSKIYNEFSKLIDNNESFKHDVNAIFNTKFVDLTDQEKQLFFNNKRGFIENRIDLVKQIAEFKGYLKQAWG